jgi:hypothetical protein
VSWGVVAHWAERSDRTWQGAQPLRPDDKTLEGLGRNVSANRAGRNHVDSGGLDSSPTNRVCGVT